MSVVRIGAVALAFATLALGAGCASSQDGGVACSTIALAPPQLVLPAPGATGVPTTVGSVIAGSPADGTFSLQADGGVPFAIGPVTSAPSPLPSGVPTFNPASFYHAVTVPLLAASTAYTLSYKAAMGPPPCGSHETSGTIGTFTTR